MNTEISPAATVDLAAIDIATFQKDTLGYYLVPPSVHLRAAQRRGWLFAIRTASALCHSYEWAAAMTAHYGPTGLHESWTEADGQPTAEAHTRFPALRFTMDRAAGRFAAAVDQAERRERRELGPYARWWAKHTSTIAA